MVYVRHRARMVRQAVWHDLRTLLEDLDWTSSTPLAIVRDHPVNFTDDFPEYWEVRGEKVPINTLAIDGGNPGPLYDWEMGGLQAQDYTFLLYFWGENEGVGSALMQDLHDRYTSQAMWSANVPLYDFLQATPTHVVDMEVTRFMFNRSPDQPTPGLSLYLANLGLTDFVDQS